MSQSSIQSVLKSQYHAALKTLRLTIEQCPDAMWADKADGAAAYWRAAYHTLFFAHLYLSADEQAFVPWARHRQQAVDLAEGNNSDYADITPYTRAEMMEYWRFCDAMIDAGVDALDLSAPTCGFSWYTVGKLEHQFVNIRHIQHHAASLSSRLRLKAGILIAWVGKGAMHTD